MELILKKGGIIFEKEWVYDENTEMGDYVETEISEYYETYLLSILTNVIKLEEGFTVRDWFKILLNYPAYQKLDLYIPFFLKEFNDCPPEGCLNEDFDIIVFQKFVTLDNYELEKEDLYECEIFVDIYGMSLSGDTHFGLDLSQIKTYLDSPIKLANGFVSKTIPILKEIKNVGEKKTRRDYTYDYKNEEVKINYKLFEFLTSFIYEISFYGTPEKRDMREKELFGMVDDIKSGKLKTVPLDLDELFKDTEGE